VGVFLSPCRAGAMLKVILMAEDVEGAIGGEGSSCLASGVVPPPEMVLVVNDSEAYQRLDVFLSHQLKDSSRSHLKSLIKDGEVLINGLPGKPSYEIRSGDRIAVRLPSPEHPGRLTPQPMTLDILYEDEDIVVINKAPGMVVHPGAGHAEGTLVHGLLAHCPRLATQGAPLRPGIVHRLDQHTSGAMVVAKSDAAYLDLINQFKEHTVEKHYLALVYGIFPQSAGEIRTALGRHPADRKKIAVLKGKGREAVTHWRVEKAWEEITLLRVTIETGRTHQIRVHFSHLQHPVIGDATYGGGKRKAQSLKSQDLRDLMEKVDRQMLHAEILALRHPRTHDRIMLKAPLADDFALVLRQLEANFPWKRCNQ
jgi:23S rRNA pseudouridine1911/1915/1917 synthase